MPTFSNQAMVCHARKIGGRNRRGLKTPNINSSSSSYLIKKQNLIEFIQRQLLTNVA
jgi:hypothetical protein